MSISSPSPPHRVKCSFRDGVVHAPPRPHRVECSNVRTQEPSEWTLTDLTELQRTEERANDCTRGRMSSEPRRYTVRERDGIEIPNDIADDMEINVELVLVVVPACSPFVFHLPIEDAEHRQIREVIVHAATNERVDVRTLRDTSIQRVHITDPCWSLLLKGEL